jgi:hypothetical protein
MHPNRVRFYSLTVLLYSELGCIAFSHCRFGGAPAGVRRDRRAVVLGVVIAVLGVLVPLGGVSAAGAETVTQTFNYTGGEQTFTVPVGVFSVYAVAVGGSGGGGTLFGGVAAQVSGELSVTTGETLYVEVGGNGGGSGGFNGGGEGAYGGGGASDVRTSPLASGLLPDERLIVAGGGGGEGLSGGSCAAGAGGAASEAGKEGSCGGEGAYQGGGAGTQSSGGNFGYGGCELGSQGQLGTGGAGGGYGDYSGYGGSGGGGGGYYGGGGGAGACGYYGGGGGGGGSSLVPAGGSVVLASSGTEPQVQFSYVPGPAPMIKKLSPKKGPAAGETSVTIAGTDFTGATAVKFDSANARSFKVDSATSITAVSPAGTTGTVEVTVTTPNGTSGNTSKDHFVYEAPTVTHISPSSGSEAGGTPVTVEGSGLGLGATTTFKFGQGIATAVNCTSTTTCTMLSPAAARTGTVDARAKVSGKTSAKNPPGDEFTYD